MKLFLQVELGHRQNNERGNYFLNYASSLSGDMMGADLDSQTEPAIADLVLRLVDQAQRVFVLIVANDANSSIGAAGKVFINIVENPEKAPYIVLRGEHRSAESMFDILPGFQKESETEKIKQLIHSFSQR